MKFILGTKESMIQTFADDGKVVPCTVISAGPATVTRVKQKPKDNSDKIQIGFGTKKTGKVNQPFRWYREFNATGDLKIGDKIDVSAFELGESVKISGLTKAKGFQGVVKRHGFHGGRRTHGQKHSEREPGSIGATAVQRVLKGVRMAGRMGGGRVTVSNLKIAKIDTEKNQLWVRGAVPGRRGTLLEIVAK